MGRACGPIFCSRMCNNILDPQGNSHLKMEELARDEGVVSTMKKTHRYDSHCLRGDDQCKAASFAFVNKAIFLQCDIFVFLNAPHSLLAHLGEG